MVDDRKGYEGLVRLRALRASQFSRYLLKKAGISDRDKNARLSSDFVAIWKWSFKLWNCNLCQK
jgi:hypothetical protein